jgi:blocked-early-in-transport protein 1
MSSRQRQRLFDGYDTRQQSSSPYGRRENDSPYPSYPAPNSATPPVGAFYAYPSSNGSTGQFRTATPNAKGQLSDATLDALESNTEEQVSGLTSKVKALKDLTIAIGSEIRDSTNLANSMNDGFDSTSTRLKGTMNRMLRMAEKTGVGWKAWLGFFAAVILLFWYVWLS